MLRGEKQNVLSLKITVPEEKAVEIVASNWIKNPESKEGLLIHEAVQDGYRRLLAPAMETETRLRSKEFADEEAIAVFSANLRKLLLAAPLGSEAVMAIDPGFRTGCKIVCLDRQGVLQCNTTIFPFLSEEKKKQAGSTVLQLLKQYEISFIAVGNGTAGRETEAFLAELEFPGGVSVGEVAYQQSAGFLRIRNGQNPLDASAVHPESYSIVLKMAASLVAEVKELIESEELRHSIRLEDFITDNAGLPTLRDIMKELEKPGRDPREAFQFFRFADVHAMKDITKDMILPGIVTNVTIFGAFVDIGIHQNGLVHISQLADRYVRNPADVV